MKKNPPKRKISHTGNGSKGNSNAPQMTDKHWEDSRTSKLELQHEKIKNLKPKNFPN